jgi:hypothetical protein
MRDHPLHLAFIMGGMWGGKVDLLGPFFGWLEKENTFLVKNQYGYDQLVLENVIYRNFYDNYFCHDEFTLLSKHRSPFPMNIDGVGFVGEVIENDGLPNSVHVTELLKYRSSYLMRIMLWLKTYIKRFLYKRKLSYLCVRNFLRT